MAKKSKDEAPNPNSISNRDILQRMNFLYQASSYLSSLSNDGQIQTKPPDKINAVDLPPDQREKQKKSQIRHERRKRRHPTTLKDLSRTYVRSMKIISQKTTVRIDPSVKRTFCKGCNIVLIPGSTATTRVKTSRVHGHFIMYNCVSCNKTLRLPAPPVLGFGEETCTTQPDRPEEPCQETSSSTAMIVDNNDEATAGAQPRKRNHKARKKRPAPRVPPFFERKVGHIVFRGNERLEDP